jgi:hypothetical protein
MTRQPRYAAIAAAIEMAAVVGAALAWASLSPLTAVIMTIAAVGALTGSFFLRRRGIIRDDLEDTQWLRDTSAVIDDDVIKALEEAKIPVSIVRAVRTVGDQPTLLDFRMSLQEQCGPQLTNEQLDTILHYTWASRRLEIKQT